MKTVLVGINSKYIHTNLAIRYLKVNCSYPITLKEYTIKDNIDKILIEILNEKPNVIGFSVYIWNVEIIKKILSKLKSMKSNITIILGGPEVSYEYDNYLLEGFADYIIVNEGEIAFNMLLDSIAYNKDIYNIPNLSYIIDNNIIRNKQREIANLESLNNPYELEDDFKNKIQYVELSRGCPYKCAYCMASLEEKVRFFNIDRVKNDILYLYSKGAKTFKFLDRTFNLKTDLALDIYKFIIENNFENAVFQFEINGEILKKEVIDYLIKNCPPNRIRFEIGIQSTNKIVNEAVNRSQNNQQLFNNIKELNKSNVDLHLDLIAGLPYEDLDSFKNTFDSTFQLYAKELQLGFLKLLKGTKLYYQKQKYGYKVEEKSPYELIENKYIKKEELSKIHIVEEILEIYWNKGFMNRSIIEMTKNQTSTFDMFLDLGKYFLNKNKSFHRYQLSDLFKTLEEYNPIYKYNIRYDYLKYNKIKPKIYWDNNINKNVILREFHRNNPNYNIDMLYKYSIVTEYYNDYLIVIYLPDSKELIKYKKN